MFVYDFKELITLCTEEYSIEFFVSGLARAIPPSVNMRATGFCSGQHKTMMTDGNHGDDNQLIISNQ